ncbi:MAG: histidine kinase N-terminal 7TM domain-containing protein [Thermosynechococcaceae cyanobacterium]
MMAGSFNLFVPILIAAAGLYVALLLQLRYSLQQQRTVLSLPLFLVGIVLWLLSYAWELSTPDLTVKIWASKVQYLGIAIVPTTWLIYTIHYAGKERWLTPMRQALFWIEPLLLLGLVWNNEQHHLIWAQMELLSVTPSFYALRIVYGPFFYVHAVYTYSILLGATGLLLGTLIRGFSNSQRAGSQLYRGQAIALLICAAAPWIGNIVYLVSQTYWLPKQGAKASDGLSAFLLLDWTPMGFWITGLAVLWGYWRFRLWDIVPIARDAILEGMRDGVMVLDYQNRILDLNPAAQNLLGLPLHKSLGQSAEVVLAPWPLLVDQFKETGNNSRFKESLHHYRLVTLELSINQVSHWFEISFSPLYGQRQQWVGQLTLWRDVTARKQAELALEKAKDAAEDASQIKSRFLAAMSHELRTPLTAILGYSEWLQQECQQHNHFEYLEDLQTIHDAGSHLLSLINNILDLSKIEAGKFSLDLESFELSPLIDELARTVEPLMKKNQNRLQVQVETHLGTLYSDAGKVRQILLNLLGNAAKFTQQGDILLQVESLDRVSGDLARNAQNSGQLPALWIRFRVQDTGIGMTPEQLQHVFQAFVQAETSTARRYGGTGLGLALSQSFCHMLGGSIAVESEFGQGSQFTVELPVHCPSDPLSPSSFPRDG